MRLIMKGGLTDLLAALAGGLAVQLSGIMPSTLNNRAKLAERVFNQAHMVKHRRMRRGGVAGHDRLNHPGVLRMRAGDATFGAKLGPAKRRKASNGAGSRRFGIQSNRLGSEGPALAISG